MVAGLDVRGVRLVVLAAAATRAARLCLLGSCWSGGALRRRRSEMRPVHRQQSGHPRPFQAVAHAHVRLLGGRAHLLAVLRRRFPLDPLVGLVLVFHERLAVLKPAEEPDEEPEEDERRQTWDEGEALDVQARPGVAAVEEHVPLHVAPVGVGVDVGGPPVVGERAAVEVDQGFGLLYRVDLVSGPHVLAVFVGLVEDLVLPHVEVQNQHEEDDAVVEPLTCNNTNMTRRDRLRTLLCF